MIDGLTEGSFFVIYSFKDQFDPKKGDNKNISNAEYREMVSKLNLVDSSSDVVIDTVADVYSLPCGSEGNTGDKDAVRTLMALDGVFGDAWFKCPVVQMAKSYASKVSYSSPVAAACVDRVFSCVCDLVCLSAVCLLVSAAVDKWLKLSLSRSVKILFMAIAVGMRGS